MSDKYCGTIDESSIGDSGEAHIIHDACSHANAAEKLLYMRHSHWDYPEEIEVWIWPESNPEDVKRFIVYREMVPHFSAAEVPLKGKKQPPTPLD